MFDIGWSEMAIIMLLALIIIGPKDLPRVARTVGQWVRKGRMLAREFQNSLEDMAKEAELDDVKKEIEKVGRTDLKKTVEKTIDPKGHLGKAFDMSDDEADKASADTGSKAAKTAQDQTPAIGGSSPNQASNGQAKTMAAAQADVDMTTGDKGKAVGKSETAAATQTAAASAAPKAAKASASSKKAGTTARTKTRSATPRKKAATPKKPAAKVKAGDDGSGPAMAAKPS